jgi:hypothetical protein
LRIAKKVGDSPASEHPSNSNQSRHAYCGPKRIQFFFYFFVHGVLILILFLHKINAVCLNALYRESVLIAAPTLRILDGERLGKQRPGGMASQAATDSHENLTGSLYELGKHGIPKKEKIFFLDKFKQENQVKPWFDGTLLSLLAAMDLQKTKIADVGGLCMFLQLTN